ncbi:hypothetical protein NK662_20610 [Ectobacillus sp. SYSU M60031]|uniref:Uncharacterized protein n=2 Tax=Ectobacillus ponti TaxID=2961894 RepID=A0AA41X8N2_9BACI|nr:hypothetical protein [Ectobacillus ponti]
MEGSAWFFWLTIPYFILGNWFLLAIAMYMYWKDMQYAGWIGGAAVLLILYDIGKKGQKQPAPSKPKAGRKKSAPARGQTFERVVSDAKDSYRQAAAAEWEREQQETRWAQEREEERREEQQRERTRAAKEEEYWERKKAEDDAYFYRRHGGPQWKIDEADDALDRNQADRDYEDEKWGHVCSGCGEPERYCKCCRDCDSYPCRCCRECGYADCRCCSSCNSYPCECCRECGYASCRCCNDCNSYPCRCCRECGYADCRCCWRCKNYPCTCD